MLEDLDTILLVFEKLEVIVHGDLSQSDVCRSMSDSQGKIIELAQYLLLRWVGRRYIQTLTVSEKPERFYTLQSTDVDPVVCADYLTEDPRISRCPEKGSIL